MRIPVKPQRWLFIVNLFVQPAMVALFGWMAWEAESTGMRVFAGSLALIAAMLFGFGVLVLVRIHGKTFEIVVGDDEVEIPNTIRGTIDRVPYRAVQRARVSETRTDATSFWMLGLDVVDGEKKRGIVVNSQFVGTEAFFQLRDALVARGVRVE